MIKAIYYIFLPIIIFLIISTQGYTKDLGIVGNTYKIIEQDSLQEILEKVKKFDIKKHISSEKIKNKIENYIPEDINLKNAKENKTYTVNLIYTLEFDITDQFGNIIYPKGFTYNPLDYIAYPYTLVVFDGKNEKHLKWFEKTYSKDINVKPLLTKGNVFKLSEKYKRPFFFINKQLVEKFQIKAIPAVIKQKNNILEIKEFYIEERGT